MSVIQVRAAYKDKTFLPLDIRTKKTRALRRKLTTAQVIDVYSERSYLS
jgi:hypothetical protein